MATSFSSTILLLFLLTITSTLPTNHASYSRSISKEEIGLKADDTQTKLTFYYQDTLSGSNPTSVQIAKTSGASNSPTTFGGLFMTDDPLTEGPKSSSKIVGRAQGMYGQADQDETAMIMIMNLMFVEGDYSGSTLSVLGRNAVSDTGVRELPIVGGTGAFRFAKGYAQIKTQTYDAKTGDSVVQYNVFVSHASSASNDTPTDDGSPSGSPGTSSSASKNGGSTSSTSHASLSSMVSFGVLVIPLLYSYLCIF